MCDLRPTLVTKRGDYYTFTVAEINVSVTAANLKQAQDRAIQEYHNVTNRDRL